MTRWWAAFIGNKQVNGRALLILILALIVGFGGTYLVHGFQVRRNAGGLLEQAGVTEGDGDKIQAIMYLEQYLGLMPSDREATAKLALLLSQESKSQRALERAYQLYDGLLRRDDDDAADRRGFHLAAAKLSIRLRRYADAKQQLQDLVNESGADADTLQLQGQAEVGLGNDKEADDYYKKAMRQSPSPAIRLDRATLLREVLHKPADADEIIAKLVEIEKSPQVRFAAARYYYVEARQPAKAWELLELLAESPNPSEEVLQLAGEVALALDKDAAARRLFERGRQLFPRNQRLSCDLALIAIRGGEMVKALALLEPVLRDPPKDVIELWNLANLLIDTQDTNAVDKARRIKEKIPRAVGGGLVDYLEARLLMDESNVGASKWAKAAAYLDSARNDPRFAKQLGRPANLLLAQCDDRLLNADQRLKALQRAVEIDPGGSSGVAAGRELAQAQAAAGEIEPALARLQRLAFFSKSAAQRVQIDEDIIGLLIDRNRALPTAKRDWREATERLFGDAALVARSVGSAGSPLRVSACPLGVTLLLERIGPTTTDSRRRLLLAEVLFLQGNVDEALAQVKAEHARNPNQVEPWLYLISLEEVKSGVAAAGAMLDLAERQLKNQVDWPLMRAGLLLKQGPEQARKRLPELLDSVEHFQGADRDRLLSGLAAALSVVGDVPEAWRRWRELAARKPDDLQVCFTLFEAALQANELLEADQALNQMQKIGGAEGAYAIFGEGALRVAKAQAAKAQRGAKADLTKTLAEARAYLARAAALRPSWSRVPLLEGLAFELEGQKVKAIQKYRAAMERGERRLKIIKHVLELMNERQMIVEANALVGSMDESTRKAPELGRIVGATLMNSGAQRQALEIARAAAKHSKEAGDYRWLATLAKVAARSVTGDARKKLLSEADQAYQRACSLEKTNPGNWMDLIYFLVETDQKQRVEETVEKAQASLGKDQSAVVLAIAADLMGHVKQAEQNFETLLALRPHDPGVLRSAAEFFERQENWPKEDETLRELLGPAVQATPKDMAWARRHRALVLAHRAAQDKNAHHYFDDANKLLEQAGLDEQQSPEFRAIQARVLAMQPTRYAEAIKAIEILASHGPLAEDLRFKLAQLYEGDRRGGGDRRLADAEAQLSILVREHKVNSTYLDRYVSVLLLQRKAGEARSWFETLQKLEPKALRTKELAIELLLIGKTKDKNRVINLVNEYAGEKNARLDWIAGWFELLGEKDKAESAYREFAKSSMQPASMLPLALHLAKNNKIAEALAICERAWATAPPEAVARATVAVVRAGQAEAAQLKAAEDGLGAALKNNPESKALPLYLAEFYEYQNRPSDSIGIYRSLLERNPRDVAALNNLAYLLALAQNETGEALKWINEALSQDRSNAEFLDTRALVYLKQNQAGPALLDLRDAFAHAPTAARYFHLARARLMNRDKAGAAEAWTAALRMGLDEASVHPLEREDYVKLRDELK